MLTNKISILIASPYEEDHRSFRAIFRRSNWTLLTASTIAESLRVLQDADVSVILCERDFPDGNWKDLLESAPTATTFPPRVIVTSADADNYLWSEVLNCGGFDVLLKPVEPQELFRVASLANRSWREQARTAHEYWMMSV
jgi:response regulator of citrate/malate metabolism